MDAFEQSVSEILWNEGYWVRTSVKVELTKEEKRQIGRPTSPRPELDIVAYQGGTNTLYVVECKSYIDSYGVLRCGFNGSNPKTANRFKLFNDSELRNVIFGRLRNQLLKSKMCAPDPSIKLCLACGKIASEKDREDIRKLFEKAAWILWDERWIKNKLEKMSKQGYENNVAVMTAKLLSRGGLAGSGDGESVYEMQQQVPRLCRPSVAADGLLRSG